jgi:hypothetical protein
MRCFWISARIVRILWLNIEAGFTAVEYFLRWRVVKLDVDDKQWASR